MLPRSLQCALLVGVAGLTCSVAQDARAGVTIDVIFQDATTPSGIVIPPGVPGPGCSFGGYLGGSASVGRCMDVMLYTPLPLTQMSVSVAYDSDNGLQVSRMDEWHGLSLVFDMPGTLYPCSVTGGIEDNGGTIQHFDCTVDPPYDQVGEPPGTYRIGTIVWDTSATTTGTELIQAVFAAGDGMLAVVNGNITDVSASVVLGSHVLTIVPEPGTAALVGLGFVGLFLAARRRRLQ